MRLDIFNKATARAASGLGDQTMGVYLGTVDNAAAVMSRRMVVDPSMVDSGLDMNSPA